MSWRANSVAAALARSSGSACASVDMFSSLQCGYGTPRFCRRIAPSYTVPSRPPLQFRHHEIGELVAATRQIATDQQMASSLRTADADRKESVQLVGLRRHDFRRKTRGHPATLARTQPEAQLGPGK